MLNEEFQRLMQMFEEGAAGKPVQLDLIFKEALTFFEHLNNQLKTGDAEEQKEALTMMKEMHAKINEQLKKIAASTGMSEEQLASYSENPGNFSQKEWAAIQEARHQMSKAGQNLVQSIKGLDEASRKIIAPPASGGSSQIKKSHAAKRAKRSDWNRS